jgi:hypothetical protein
VNKFSKFLIPIISISLLLSGCGSSSSSTSSTSISSDSYSFSDAMSISSAGYSNYSGASSSSSYSSIESSYDNASSNTDAEEAESQQGAKLIRTVSMDIETTKFDDLNTYIAEKTSQLGGYVETSEMYEYSSYRSLDITVRVPYSKVDDFLDGLDGNGSISHMSDNTQDITLQYSNLETKLENLETQHSRLLVLLNSATSLDDIIVLEDRLCELETEIDSYTKEIKNYDNLTTYSTINLYVTETTYIYEESDDTVWGRITSGLSDNLHDIAEGIVNIFVWFIVNIPNIIIFLIVIFILWFVFKKVFKRLKPIIIEQNKNPYEKNVANTQPKETNNVKDDNDENHFVD